jgi:hypothetical protein
MRTKRSTTSKPDTSKPAEPTRALTPGEIRTIKRIKASPGAGPERLQATVDALYREHDTLITLEDAPTVIALAWEELPPRNGNSPSREKKKKGECHRPRHRMMAQKR